MDESSKHGANTSRETQVGNFTLIIDETTAEPSGKGSRVDKHLRKGNTALWRWTPDQRRNEKRGHALGPKQQTYTTDC